MNYPIIVVLAIFLLVFGSFSKKLSATIITAPMVFIAFGFLIGDGGLGIFTFSYEREAFNIVAELTLVLVLFSDASRIDLKCLFREHDLPIRMLTIGMILTIVSGTALALIFFADLSVMEAAVLAVILTPTDAALAQAVIGSDLLPIRIRQALNVESGLNDGIALPFLILFLVLSGHMRSHQESNMIIFALRQLLLGPAIGIGIGYAGAKLLLLANRRGWIEHSFLSLSAVALAVLSYAGAELAGGNGFIAAFVAGLIMGNVAREICTTLYNFAEAEGQLLMLFTFVVFSGSMLPAVLPAITWQILVYSLLSLTVVRMLPVALSLIGKKLMWETTFLLGWFGPRGIASIIYVLIVLREAVLPGETTILVVTVVTVGMSIILHGLSSLPLTKWYAKEMNAMDEADIIDLPEMVIVEPMRTRKL